MGLLSAVTNKRPLTWPDAARESAVAGHPLLLPESRNSQRVRPKAKYRRLRRAELPIDTVELARYLIGKTLVHELESGRRSGTIVETEAYVVGDAAAHAFRGMTPRNRSLFLERGHAYVYFCYGCWFMLNVSGETEGVGAGVLLRALEPLESPEALPNDKRRFDLARGPGRLARWMQVDRRHDGLDLCGPASSRNGPLWLGTAVRTAGAIGESVRIGITREAHRVLRFYERGSPFVSGSQRLRE
jgi:DNA-3-methyladenine glycosylase